MAPVISILNIKGGIGKTTTYNLGALRPYHRQSPPVVAQSAEDQAYELLFGGKMSPQQEKKRAKLPIECLHPFCTANIGFKPYS